MSKMLCLSCGCEWDVPDSMHLQLDKCPFCNQSLKKREIQFATSIQDALNEISLQFGSETLNDGKKTLAFFTDIAPSLKRERRIISCFVNCNGHAELYNVRHGTKDDQKIAFEKVVHQMVEDWYIAEQAARMVCQAYLDAIVPKKSTELHQYSGEDEKYKLDDTTYLIDKNNNKALSIEEQTTIDCFEPDNSSVTRIYLNDLVSEMDLFLDGKYVEAANLCIRKLINTTEKSAIIEIKAHLAFLIRFCNIKAEQLSDPTLADINSLLIPGCSIGDPFSIINMALLKLSNAQIKEAFDFFKTIKKEDFSFSVNSFWYPELWLHKKDPEGALLSFLAVFFGKSHFDDMDEIRQAFFNYYPHLKDPLEDYIIHLPNQVDYNNEEKNSKPLVKMIIAELKKGTEAESFIANNINTIKELATKLGNPYLLFYIGRSYELGIGVEKNISEAKKWYYSAADLKYNWAYLKLARIFEVEENSLEAVKYYELAFQARDIRAAHSLCLIYYKLAKPNDDIVYYNKAIETAKKTMQFDSSETKIGMEAFLKEKLQCAYVGERVSKIILKKHKKDLSSISISFIKTQTLPVFKAAIRDCITILREEYDFNTIDAIKEMPDL